MVLGFPSLLRFLSFADNIWPYLDHLKHASPFNVPSLFLIFLKVSSLSKESNKNHWTTNIQSNWFVSGNSLYS